MKKQFKSAASSAKAAPVGSAFGGFGVSSSFALHSSPLAHVYEPPNLSLISDANLIVQFKNAMKRDPTTKAKALQDIQSHVTSSPHDPEEALLAAWVKLYPRLSIDVSRRVRQLAHSVLGHIASRSGKRTGPHLPQLVGPWLCGLHDSDKGVARSAREALALTFAAPEKLRNIWKLLQRPLVQYCRDAILNESPQSLSDERIVSKEDSDATYGRVVATALSVIAALLDELPAEELGKCSDVYEQLLRDGKLWEFSSSPDVGIRRAIIKLLETCLENGYTKPILDLGLVGTTLINKAIVADQTSTAAALAQVLVDVTRQQPTVWTTDYKGKKQPESRIRNLVKKGAQSSPPSFWRLIHHLFVVIPADALPSDLSGLENIVAALFEGISSKDERLHAATAWSAYFRIVDLLSQRLGETDRSELLAKWVVPVLDQFFHPTEATAKWTPPAAKAEQIVAQSLQCTGVAQILNDRWSHFTAPLLDRMRTSQPEQSKTFDESQAAVIFAGQRWTALQVEIRSSQAPLPEPLSTTLARELATVTKTAIDLLVSRRGKPYGAAAVLEDIVRSRERLQLAGTTVDDVSAFLSKDALDVLDSPAQPYLFRIVYENVSDPTVQSAWRSWASTLADQAEKDGRSDTLRRFLSAANNDTAKELARNDAGIQSFLRRLLVSTDTFDSDSDPKLLSLVSEESRQQILTSSVEALTLSDRREPAFGLLKAFDKTEPQYFAAFLTTSRGRELFNEVIKLQQSSDPSVAEKATALLERMSGSTGGGASKPVSIDLLRAELNDASHKSIPISKLLQMTTGLLESGDAALWDLVFELVGVLKTIVDDHGISPPHPSLAIMSNLGGALYLVEPPTAQSSTASQVDGQGVSRAVRIAVFFSLVLSKTKELSFHPEEKLMGVFETMLYIAFFTDDDISISTKGNQWLSRPNHETETLVVEFISKARNSAADFMRGKTSALESISADITAPSASDLIKARCYADLTAPLFDASTAPENVVPLLEQKIAGSRKDKNVLLLAAGVRALSPLLASSRYLQRYCNELLSGLTGADASEQQDDMLRDLVLLNLALCESGGLEGVFAKQRVVFYLQHTLPWLSDPLMVDPVRSELLVSLQKLLPILADTYGEHWSQMVKAITLICEEGFLVRGQLDELRLTTVHAALRLKAVLSAISQGDDANEDLSDALQEQDAALQSGLLRLLLQEQTVEESTHAPLQITNNLIARQAKKLTKIDAATATDLFPLLDSRSQALQDAALSLLQSYTNDTQEQVSFDAVLEKKAVHLPEELLSLILSAPTVDSVLSADFTTGVPEDLKSYLYSWLLLFTHFTKASAKVREDYAEELKSGEYLAPLLDIVFEFLGHTTGHPVNVSKFDVQSYSRNVEGNAETDTQWLLTHLYYLGLTYLSSLARFHILSITNRQTSTAISTWTAKFISPPIISASLANVESWTKTFSSDPEYENFSVKVSPAAREITASYLIDEQTMSMLIRLPASYPLQGAVVEGPARIAVDQRKWQAWLRAAQGVIRFSNGDIVDGIASWRRNVRGALRGAVECAICYSVVSAGRELPNKRCGTCKNAFHAGCLYRWFQSSNGSTCPLCRNLFNYG